MKRSVTRHCRTAAGLSILAMTARASAVVFGQIDTFNDSTTDNWAGGGTTAISTGGPAGASDPFLEVVGNGADGPGSKLITYNRNQWIGDYVTAGVNQISVDLKDFGTTTLSIRIAFKDATGQSAAGYATTNAYILPADSAWHHATFSVSTAAMTALNSPVESFNSLIGPGGALAEFRILDSASPSLFGDVVAANLGIDNVTAGSTGPVIASSTWNAGSGSWETGGHWLSGTPAYGAGQTATFPDPIGTAPVSATVTLGTDKTIGNLAFTASLGGSYNIAATGGSALSLNNSNGSGIHLVSTAGNVNISAPLILSSSVTAAVDGSALLTFSGKLTGSGGLTKTGTGTLAIASQLPGAGQVPLSLSSLSINSGIFILGSSASHSDRTLLMLGNLSITGGQLDLGGNDAIIKGISPATVQTLVRTGFNGGAWNGAGTAIVSSLAASDASHLTAVGTISGVTSFDNSAVLTSDVLVKYTYYGDSNLDGHVDGSDYSRIDNGYLSQATGWYNGDFNYDGQVNGSDYTLIDNTFNTQGLSLAAQAADTAGAVFQPIDGSAIPEPIGITVGLIVAISSLNNRARFSGK